MGDERPEALLKSALEKIVYFEARSEQLHNDLTSSRAECDRLKAELAGAAQREIQLRRAMAELEVKAKRSHAEREELARVNEALREERAALLGKVLEAARIHGADAAGEGLQSHFDLASFISELRNEVLRQKAGEPLLRKATSSPPSSNAISSATPTPDAPRTPTLSRQDSAVAGHALRLSSEGRLGVSAEQVLELSSAARFPGRTEETLFGFSVRELSAPDSQARQRAAERLRALGNSAAAPALATALHGETDPPTQVALLRAFSALAKEEGASVVQPLLQSPVADVRIAALKALIEIDPSQTGPHVAAAMSDPDPTVRRRASLLALGLTGEAAMKLGEQALADSDGDVRRLGALVLGAGHGEQARTLLLEALRDREQKVRHAAAQSLSRILGQDLSSIVTLEEPQRRREVRRLAQIPARPMQIAPAPLALSPAARAVQATVSPVAHSVGLSRARTGARSATAESVAEPVLASAPTAEPTFTTSARTDLRMAVPDTSESLSLLLMTEIRCALRGRSLSELVSVSQSSPEVVEQTCDLLVARGQVVRRGLKYFAA